MKLQAFEYKMSHECIELEDSNLQIVVDTDYEDDRIVRWYYLVYPDGQYRSLPFNNEAYDKGCLPEMTYLWIASGFPVNTPGFTWTCDSLLAYIKEHLF